MDSRFQKALTARSLVLFLGTLGLLEILGGSWVVISGVISPLIWVISIVTLLNPTYNYP